MERSGRASGGLIAERRWLGLVPVVALCLFACQAQATRTAPFRDRPDSVRPGDLRGPFEGEVVESASGKPVAGALVYATWTLQTGYGMSQPSGFEQYVTNTDAAGAYAIPALQVSNNRTIRVTDFYLVVYKKGYVGYRSDRRFSDLGPRRDFAQQKNRVELKRWREEYSHARHLRYIGGGPAIAALTAWEVDDAAAELTGAGPVGNRRVTSLLPPQTGTYLVAAQLLTADDVKKLTGFDGEFETGPLGDEPDTSSYSSQHLKALGRPENYDVAVRLWRVQPAEAKTRYAGLADSLPNAEERNEIADRSLRATEGSIFGTAFLDSRRNVVVLVTCGQAQCNSADIGASLAKHVHRRIEELWPLGVAR
ncbi:MAG: carboxypeptidase-like regulatory domain-containing protein [Proteobacteria bacterium]|nr:carboxypeptidase-like regulatory domain-containing protein [Pseudomonadota bacterium]